MKYHCMECGKQFSTLGNVKNHKKTIHDGIKIQCRECEHQATSKGTLTKHKRVVHEGIQYPCENVCITQQPREILQKSSSWRNEIPLNIIQFGALNCKGSQGDILGTVP